MRVTFCALALAMAVAVPASAQDEVIAVRQAIMKLNEASIELAFDMSEGDIPYDAKLAKLALLSIAADLTNFQQLFPDDSQHPPTNALPAVWSNRPAFTALAQKMIGDATAAANDTATADTLTDSKPFAEVQKNCTTCHTMFRKPLT